MRELETLHEKAISDLQVETLKQVGSATVMLLSPAWGTILGVAGQVTSDDSDLVNALNVTSEALLEYGDDVKFLKPFNDRGGAALSIAANTIGYFDRVKEIDAQYAKEMKQAKQDVQDDRMAILFDHSGTHVKGRRHNYYYYTSDYDLAATLQMDDLEKNGLRGYVFRESLGSNTDSSSVNQAVEEVKAFDSYLDKVPTGEGYTQEMKEFFSGQSDQTVSDIGINNISEGLKDFSDRVEEYNDGKPKEIIDFDQRDYRKANPLYFDKLVEGTQYE